MHSMEPYIEIWTDFWGQFDYSEPSGSSCERRQEDPEIKIILIRNSHRIKKNHLGSELMKQDLAHQKNENSVTVTHVPTWL